MRRLGGASRSRSGRPGCTQGWAPPASVSPGAAVSLHPQTRRFGAGVLWVWGWRLSDCRSLQEKKAGGTARQMTDARTHSNNMYASTSSDDDDDDRRQGRGGRPSSQRPSRQSEHAGDSFEAIDADGDGVVSKHEWVSFKISQQDEALQQAVRIVLTTLRHAAHGLCAC